MADILDFLRQIDLNELLTADYRGALGTIMGALRDPQANLPLALTLFALATLLVSILFIAIVAFFITSDEEDDEDGFVEEANTSVVVTAAAASTTEESTSSSRSRYVTAAVWALFAALLWGGMGWATSNDDICAGCHTKTIHSTADSEGTPTGPKPHQNVRCVSCHESPSAIERYGWGTVPRAVHFAGALVKLRADEYGVVGSHECSSCHDSAIEGTVTNVARGLKMSHRAPVDAGWECMDCHAVARGDLGTVSGGMTRCVRCHDGTKASTKCETCHTGDISATAGQSRDHDPQVLVPAPDCGGCHNQQKSCDPCHGIRLPHTGAFLEGGHARVYAQSLWYGDGKACVKCHNAQRRPCSGCHQSSFPSHAKSWAKDHQLSDPRTDTCTGCHNMTKGKRPGRNFCIDLCHTDHEEWR